MILLNVLPRFILTNLEAVFHVFAYVSPVLNVMEFSLPIYVAPHDVWTLETIQLCDVEAFVKDMKKKY